MGILSRLRRVGTTVSIKIHLKHFDRKMQATLTIRGSGTSMGVPTLGCECRVCTSPDPRDRRIGQCSPGGPLHPYRYRPGFPRTGSSRKDPALDAVFYTHSHADHILGLDDLRPLSFRHPNGHMPLYADDAKRPHHRKRLRLHLLSRVEIPHARPRQNAPHERPGVRHDVAGVQLSAHPADPWRVFRLPASASAPPPTSRT